MLFQLPVQRRPHRRRRLPVPRRLPVRRRSTFPEISFRRSNRPRGRRSTSFRSGTRSRSSARPDFRTEIDQEQILDKRNFAESYYFFDFTIWRNLKCPQLFFMSHLNVLASFANIPFSIQR